MLEKDPQQKKDSKKKLFEENNPQKEEQQDVEMMDLEELKRDTEELKNEEEKKAYTEIIMVQQGKIDVNFAHSACFIRKDDCTMKQLLLLDCKNSEPLYYPTVTELQGLADC